MRFEVIFYQNSNSSNVYLSSSRFWTTTTRVIFYQLPSVSKSRIILLTTPWSSVLLEKLTGSAASQEIPRIFGTRRFLTVPISARQLSLSWTISIQSPQLPPTSWRSILILSSKKEWRKLHNEELSDLYSLPNIVRVVKSKSRIPPKNVWSFQNLTPVSLLHQYQCFCSRYIGFETKFYGNSLFISAIHDV